MSQFLCGEMSIQIDNRAYNNQLNWQFLHKKWWHDIHSQHEDKQRIESAMDGLRVEQPHVRVSMRKSRALNQPHTNWDGKTTCQSQCVGTSKSTIRMQISQQAIYKSSESVLIKQYQRHKDSVWNEWGYCMCPNNNNELKLVRADGSTVCTLEVRFRLLGHGWGYCMCMASNNSQMLTGTPYMCCEQG